MNGMGGLVGSGGAGGNTTISVYPTVQPHQSWTFYSPTKIGNFATVRGEDFDPRSMFATSFRLDFSECAQHVNVFAACFPEIKDYAGIMLPSELSVLVFSTKQHADVFETWFAKYRSFYSSKEDDCLPSSLIPAYEGSGGLLALVDVKERLWNQNELVRMWAWIVTHCEKPVAKIDRFLAFECGKDAAKFKLAYT